MMTTTADALSSYRVFYRAARKVVLDRIAEYDADVREWYVSGDGAAPDWQRAGDQPWFSADFDNPDRMINMGGKGYRYPVCIHGTDLTTDYDNICGGCEEGATVAQQAQGIAREQWRRYEWVMSAPRDLPNEYRNNLVAWVFEINRF
jgi:hypothetical protein